MPPPPPPLLVQSLQRKRLSVGLQLAQFSQSIENIGLAAIDPCKVLTAKSLGTRHDVRRRARHSLSPVSILTGASRSVPLSYELAGRGLRTPGPAPGEIQSVLCLL